MQRLLNLEEVALSQRGRFGRMTVLRSVWCQDYALSQSDVVDRVSMRCTLDHQNVRLRKGDAVRAVSVKSILQSKSETRGQLEVFHRMRVERVCYDKLIGLRKRELISQVAMQSVGDHKGVCLYQSRGICQVAVRRRIDVQRPCGA